EHSEEKPARDDGGGGERCEGEVRVEVVKHEGGESVAEAEKEEEDGTVQGDPAVDDGTGTEGLSSDDVAVDEMEERPVEDILAELSLSGQKALEGSSDTSSPGAPPAYGEHLLPVSGGSPSIGRSNIIRSLFSDDDGQGQRGLGE
ncbi:unnamed protein product, partial [Laminaria digitata]